MSRIKKGTQIEVEDKETGEKTTGKVVVVDDNQKKVTIVTPEGKEKVVDLLQFIVTVIPLLDQIINWIKSFFRRKKS